MNKKILIGSIIAIAILIGVSFTSVASVTFQIPNKIHQSSKIYEEITKVTTNNMNTDYLYVCRAFIYGIIKDFNWKVEYLQGYGWLWKTNFTVIDVVVTGMFWDINNQFTYNTSVRLYENKGWKFVGLSFFNYYGLGMLVAYISKPKYHFLLGIIRDGEFHCEVK
jgi:hypothetical protein